MFSFYWFSTTRHSSLKIVIKWQINAHKNALDNSSVSRRRRNDNLMLVSLFCTMPTRSHSKSSPEDGSVPQSTSLGQHYEFQPAVQYPVTETPIRIHPASIILRKRPNPAISQSLNESVDQSTRWSNSQSVDVSISTTVSQHNTHMSCELVFYTSFKFISNSWHLGRIP